MKELVQLLSNIPDAYDDFILGTINYAKKDVSHISILKDFMRGKTNLVSSDIIAFIVSQPDFHSYSVTKKMECVKNDTLNLEGRSTQEVLGMAEEMGTDKELATSLVNRYLDLQRIKNAKDRDIELDNQIMSVEAQLEICGVNIEDLKIKG